MQKKAFLAIFLSVVILFSWQLLMQKAYHVDNESVRLSQGSSGSGEAPIEKPLLINNTQSSPPGLSPVLLKSLNTGKLQFEFQNPGNKISNVFIKDYNLMSNLSNLLYKKELGNKNYELNEEKYQFSENGHLNVQIIEFDSQDPYLFTLEINYENKTKENWVFNEKLILSKIEIEKISPVEGRLLEVVSLEDGSKRKNPFSVKNKFVFPEKTKKLALRDRYSCLIVDLQSQQLYEAFIEKYDKSIEVGLDMGILTVPANGQINFKYTIYLGPQDIHFLKQSKLGFEEIIHYGTFDFISRSLLAILNFFQKLSHSLGFALILLSVFIYLLLYPLTLKQMRSMKEMQDLQPQIEALKRNCKDNPQKLNKELMELYRKHGVNPLGGCLPMILQIPIFLGLYQALSRSIVLKGSQFLWIKDLAESDKLFILPNPLPFIGKEINLLPILMAIAMFIQQKITLKAGSAAPEMQEQQKIMVIVFPIMFGFLFYHFPSGLTLYWFLNTLFGTFAQWKILKAKALLAK